MRALLPGAPRLFPAFGVSSRKVRNVGIGVQKIPIARTISLRSPQYRGLIKKGEVVGVNYYRITTNQNSRDFTTQHHVTIVSSEGTLQDAEVSVSTVVQNADDPDVTNCVGLPPSGDQITGFHRLSEWKQVAGREWHNTKQTRSSRKEGVDQEGSCTMTPNVWVYFPSPSGGKYALSVTSNPRTVRCDSSPLLKWYKNGGCVVMRGVTALSMAYSDEIINPDTGVRTSFPEVNDHIWLALEHPYLTKPGRKSYYDLDPDAKDIPGNWGDWLSRAKYRPTPGGSRGLASSACKIEYSAAQREGKQCDEFPFASLEQGADNAKPKNNYSVMPVMPAQNEAHGIAIAAWCKNNRIIRSDKFWIQMLD